jgi:cobalamin synthase
MGFPISPLSTVKEIDMNMQLSLAPLVALIAGILILVVPRLLNYIVAIYLIIIGLIGLFGGGFHMR